MSEDFSTLRFVIEYDIKYMAPSDPIRPIHLDIITEPLRFYDINEVDNDLLVFQFKLKKKSDSPKYADKIKISLWKAKDGLTIPPEADSPDNVIVPPPLAPTVGGWVVRGDREDCDLFNLHVKNFYDPIPIFPNNINKEVILKEDNLHEDNWNSWGLGPYILSSQLPNGFPGWRGLGCHSHEGVPSISFEGFDPNSGYDIPIPCYHGPVYLRVATRIGTPEIVPFLVLLEIKRARRLKLAAFPVVVKTHAFDQLIDCLITTAAFGSPMSQEINILRNWRDYSLGTTNFGQRLIELYYILSPSVAKIIVRSEKLRKTVRGFLKPLIRFLSKKYNNIR